MHAQEFVNIDGGFATCLRNMQSAAKQGAAIDFSSWGEAAKELVGLDRTTLDALLDLYADFHGAKCSAGLKKSNALGVSTGRRKIKLPNNFEQEVERWLTGEITATEAAKNCHMAASTFYTKVKQRQKSYNAPEALDAVVTQWEERKISTKDAALKLGVSPKVFTKILTSRGAKRGFMPASFDRYFELFQNGTLTKDEAAKLCGISVAHFDCCVSKHAGVVDAGTNDTAANKAASNQEVTGE